MKQFTKESLVGKLEDIRAMGWIETARPGNDGGVGNTLEDLLGIQENNLPLPNSGEWEVKGQRADSGSLITLFHMEPSCRAFKFVPRVFLPKYGWRHKKAGQRYPNCERSFRQTITAGQFTSRGFTIFVNHKFRRVEVSFDSFKVNIEKHEDWLNRVERLAGLGELNPQPYWGFDDLYHKAGTKLKSTIYAVAERKRRRGVEHFRYSQFFMLEKFRQDKFVSVIESGDIKIDFDARTGHNHGTKFRLKQQRYTDLYDSVIPL
ncbi:MAG: MvaI/BcnI family restriction endonuclease [Rhodobacteraceae bacterium]|nr:MvaI/BcnI family restriction endonuclease [Paracoccaceae bacterium]